MAKRTSILAAVAALVIIAAPALCLANRNEEDNFRWQDASREMDALPFTRAFIDSVTKEHLGGPSPLAQRRIQTNRPFMNGETLVYEVRWGLFRAGFVILTATPHRDRGLIRIGGKAMTGNIVSAIYKVRNYDISWIDAEGLYPHFYEHHAREGNKYRMDSYIIYDNTRNKLFLERRGLQEHETPRFTHDFMSLIYYVRSKPLNPGDRFEANLFTRPNTHPIRFSVQDRRETIQTAAGSFNCVKVELTAGGDGRVFGRRDKIEVWISDDNHKYPVMLRSRAKIGSLQARLVTIMR
ncbi:MAG: DUF3108 domain-containing protein [Chitinispirillales bacterium]|nr:DUF3108 domain-containing protein [Chitinispirillales bacterium]